MIFFQAKLGNSYDNKNSNCLQAVSNVILSFVINFASDVVHYKALVLISA